MARTIYHDALAAWKRQNPGEPHSASVRAYRASRKTFDKLAAKADVSARSAAKVWRGIARESIVTNPRSPGRLKSKLKGSAAAKETVATVSRRMPRKVKAEGVNLLANVINSIKTLKGRKKRFDSQTLKAIRKLLDSQGIPAWMQFQAFRQAYARTIPYSLGKHR